MRGEGSTGVPAKNLRLASSICCCAGLGLGDAEVFGLDRITIVRILH